MDKKDDTMTTNDNEETLEALIRQTNENRFKAWNTGDRELMVANLSDDFKRYTNGNIDVDEKSAYPSIMDFYINAFPDLHFEYELMAVEGNKSFTQWTASGRNTGPYKGQPATDRQVLSQGFTMVTYDEDGKAMIEEAYVDNMGILNSLGYAMTPPSAQ
jgi:steroid delta-isomerase-like uncharacterized protein